MMRLNGFLVLAVAIVLACQQPSVGQAENDIQFVNWGPGQQAQAPVAAADATAGSCDVGCGDVGCCDAGCDVGCCVGPCCGPCCYAFGEFLFLRPRSSEVVYGAIADGPLGAPGDIPVQVAPLSMVDAEFEVGFRVVQACASTKRRIWR